MHSGGLLFIIKVYAVHHLASFPTSNTSRVQLCYGFIRDGWLNNAAVPILVFGTMHRVHARPGTVASTPSVSTRTNIFFSYHGRKKKEGLGAWKAVEAAAFRGNMSRTIDAEASCLNRTIQDKL